MGDCALTSVKGILVVGAGVVGNLETRSAVIGVLEKIDVGALVEAVMRRFGIGRAVEVMDIPMAAGGSATMYVSMCYFLEGQAQSRGGAETQDEITGEG